jgi:S-adenosylmethionine hydrolase
MTHWRSPPSLVDDRSREPRSPAGAPSTIRVTGSLPIVFLSDYGSQDDFVGVCHGVIQRIAPGAIVIDLAHGLPRGEARVAALVLRNSLRFVPSGVHLAVVDPGVGTHRRPIALRCRDGRLLVGPDNGLLWLAAEAAGGIEAAVDLEASPFSLEPVSATFHGRDIFAPVAAALALGTPLEQVGGAFPPSQVTSLELPAPVIEGSSITAHVAYVDTFGNSQLGAASEDARAAGFEPGDVLTVRVADRSHRCLYGRTFADVPGGDLLLYEDSYGALALAVRHGDAAAELGLRLEEPVRLTR